MPAASFPLIVLAYLVGTVPTAQVVARRWGVDPTAAGSHNPGASNVTRLVGRWAGLLVLAGELGKGAVATGVGLAVGGRSLALLCGLAVVLGHVVPVTRWFQGGKGVATAAGVSLVLWPAAAAVLVVVWVATLAAWRRASLASMAAAATAPVVVGLAGAGLAEIAGSFVIGAVVLVRHRDNLRRIRRGDGSTLAAH
jgi:glycerol-3-phosphate acyltransferase PlsY